MPLSEPIRILYDDDWRAEFVETEAGGLRVTVSSPDARAWSGEKPTIEEAIALAQRIRESQRPARPDQPVDADGTLAAD